MIILFFGAVVNIAINYFLIPILGIEGASLATLFGYVVSDVVGVVVLYKMKLMILEKRFIWAALGMVGYFVVWRLLITSNWPVGTLFAFVAVVFFAYLYKKELIDVVRALRKR
jgi:O-antigen/teichoic acid export membrane protein